MYVVKPTAELHYMWYVLFRVSRRTVVDGHQEQENTLNQLLVEMDGESFYTHCLIQSPFYLRHGYV